METHGLQGHAGACRLQHRGCGTATARAPRGGYACISCTEPGFEEPGPCRSHETPKIAGIPIGLPTDMPKAWFVALAVAVQVRRRRSASSTTRWPTIVGRAARRSARRGK
ncbi:MAG: hypothetical protein MZW92_57615 [Comamonadaceae bacterium]|nr:hypothetical protein [Comamonadaceae bacterium]